MRTTIDLEDDILFVTKELARQRGVSMGKVLSDLARQALARTEPPNYRNGIPLFPVRPGAEVVTMELINQLRDRP